MSKINNYLIYLFIFSVLIAFPSVTKSQDTIDVKLGPTSITDNSLNSLRASRVIINFLIPSTDYIINTTQDEDRYADILGLREINPAIIPENFIATDPVLKSDVILLGHSGRDARNLEDIINDDVGVISKSFAHHRFREYSQFAYEFNSISELFSAFFNENVDFIIVESSIAKSILDNASNDSDIKIYNHQLFTSEIGFLINTESEYLVEYLNTRIASFKDSTNYSTFIDEYYTVPAERFWPRYIMILIIILVLSFGLYLLFKNKEVLSRLLKSYNVQMNGIMQIRPLPSIKFLDDEASIKNSFKEKYSTFQINNPGINTEIEFNGQAVKVTFISEPDLKVSDTEYLDIVAHELEDLIKAFPVNQFIIDLNISGHYQSLTSKMKFTFSNTGNTVDYIIQNK